MAGVLMSPAFRDQVVDAVKYVRGTGRGHDPLKQGRLQQETRYQGYFLTTLEALGENDTEPPTAEFEVWQVDHEDTEKPLTATGYIIEVTNRQCDLTITPSDLSRVEMHDGEWRPYVWEDHSLCSSSSTSGSGSVSGSGSGSGSGGSSSGSGGSPSISSSGSALSISSSSSSSSSCVNCYCWLPTATISGGWGSYEDGSVSLTLTNHEATDEGVDSSDDAATAIRPPTSNPGTVVLELSPDGDTTLAAGDFIPSGWTQITGVKARIRAKVVEYGETTPTDQVVEVKVGDDGDAEEAGDCTFTISGTTYQTYEEDVTGGKSLPANVNGYPEDTTAIDWEDFVSRWEMSEYRKSETSLEISAIEVCVEGS